MSCDLFVNNTTELGTAFISDVVFGIYFAQIEVGHRSSMALSKHPADIEVRSKRTTFVVLFPNRSNRLGAGLGAAVIQRGTELDFTFFAC